MKRLLAIWRCVWHGLMPPQIEELIYGRVHYMKEPRDWDRWVVCFFHHVEINMVDATLIAFAPHKLSEEDRKFHEL